MAGFVAARVQALPVEYNNTEADRNFINSKRIMHYLLISLNIEPMNTDQNHPRPSMIDHGCSDGEILYKALGYEYTIKLFARRGINHSYEFILRVSFCFSYSSYLACYHVISLVVLHLLEFIE